MFKPASKDLAKLKIALTGPAGSGKTLSSLLLAKGIGGRVAAIDSENRSMSLYADQISDFSFDICAIDPPYTAQKYLAAIDFAVKEKYDILLVDSLTHVWAGEGGLLAQKEALDSRGGNSYTNWASITKLHEQLKSKILHSPIHLIATMRSKQEYVLEMNDKGKSVPKKVGMAPIQRDGLEYEFTVVFDIGMDHQYMVTKDRTGLFDGVVEKISDKTGRHLMAWLGTPKVAETTEPSPPSRPAQESTGDQYKESQFPREYLEAKAKREAVEREMESKSRVESLMNDPEDELDQALNELDKDPPPMPPAKNLNLGSAGEYVIPFGKYTGKSIKDIGIHEAARYLDWLIKQAEDAGKNLHGSGLVFRDKVNACLNVCGGMR